MVEKKVIKLFQDLVCYESEEEYLADTEAINAHLIMNYATNDTLGFKKTTGKKSYFTIGRLVEEMVFLSQEEITKKYFIVPKYSSEAFSQLESKIVTKVLATLDPIQSLNDLNNIDGVTNVILPITKDLQLFNTIKKSDTLYNKLLENKFFENILNIINNLNKLAITEEDYQLATLLSKNIKNSKVTKNIFKLQGEPGIEFIYQFRTKINNFVSKGLSAKIAVDLLVIDHNTKSVFIYDVKTDRHSLHEFLKESYYFYKLDLQMDFYEAVLYQIILKYFPGYHLKKARLLVVSKGYPEQEAVIFVRKEGLSSIENSSVEPTNKKTLQSYILDILDLRDFAGGSLDKLSTLNQPSYYYFNNNFVNI